MCVVAQLRLNAKSLTKHLVLSFFKHKGRHAIGKITNKKRWDAFEKEQKRTSSIGRSVILVMESEGVVVRSVSAAIHS